MFKTVLFVCAWIVLLPTLSATAQEKAWDNARLTREVRKINESVGKLRSNIDAINEQTQVINENTHKATQLCLTLNKELDATRDDIKVLTSEIRNLNAKHGSILDAISADDESGNRYLRLDAIMNKSVKGRTEFRSAVERSVREHGTLTIVNKMGTAQDVIVNGIQHRVLVGAKLPLKVSVGTVTTKLPGQEGVHWTIGPANKYAQSIDIVPRYTTNRMASGLSNPSMSIGPPIYYYETPFYYSTDPWYWGSYAIYY